MLIDCTVTEQPAFFRTLPTSSKHILVVVKNTNIIEKNKSTAASTANATFAIQDALQFKDQSHGKERFWTKPKKKHFQEINLKF